MERAFSSWPQAASVHPKQSEQSKDKPKKPRHRHTAAQLAALNELYDKNEHPALDERTALAERLGMETKTVNAWFQNKRASTKKRHRSGIAPIPTYDIPPISSLLTSASSSTSTPPGPNDIDDLAEPEQQQQSAFYAGNPEHRHIYETAPAEMPTRPRMRQRPTSQQSDELKKFYNSNPHPTKEEREALGERIGMRYQSVTNWFQNQRSMAKKRQEEDMEVAASPSQQSGSQHSADSRTYSSYPPASEHPSLLPASHHPSLVAILSRETRSPSAPPSNASVSSRASPYRNLIPSQRPRRTRPEPYQLDALQKLYDRTSNPSIEERGALALAVGMDLTKVTNWFRNLRQTARKRTRKTGDDGDTDSVQLDSASVSRAVTPSFTSSSSSAGHEHDHGMETEMDENDRISVPMEDDAYERLDHTHVHSDIGSDDEYQEAVTPPLGSSPSPSPKPSFVPAPFIAPPVPHHVAVGAGMDIDPVKYAELQKIPGRISGVKVEDALLLLSFHHHIVH
ncbi:hypothetical protein HETIRDRAFT_58809 [Heterobasidion irregulare TC 32-1]|uniref:Homeobox domain-containing protein n=1 Tax=Heterobasidion irregulare (strain TC 32-1) TaxID=747525 RepID=W4KLZ0_HETIT|nr:uncharacterized protein HETIRDRAFT_58809 [Heterobasidion irregulare TC 32-1]ETW86848.1 hypothetical protein HETIRDRAFT_58809 [Heterobasidion irregulare TC 32-1]